jgi:hypothetical protein
MFKFNSRIILFILILSIGAFSILSCSKKPEAIGLNLVEDGKLFVGYDTAFAVAAYSGTEDSVRTDGTSKSLLGSHYTYDFGITNASFASQLRLTSIQDTFGMNPVADSVILKFVYAGYYGNIETEQSISVYELSESMSINDTMYANSELEYYPEPLGELTFYPTPDDSLIIDSTYYPAELRIPIDNSFAELLFENIDSLSEMSSFLNLFKGIYVRADDVFSPGTGAILSLNILADRSRLTVHYHNDDADSLSMVLGINTFSARYGKFEHQYELSSDPLFKDQINGDTLLGEEKLYLQGLSGIRTVIKFPEIKAWAENNVVAINQAMLTIPVDNSLDTDLDPPGQLVLVRIDNEGRYIITFDQQEGDNYFGGYYNADRNEYQFRISRYIQSLISGDFDDYGLAIFISGKTINANGAVLSGTNQELARRMKLEVIFTEVE